MSESIKDSIVRELLSSPAPAKPTFSLHSHREAVGTLSEIACPPDLDGRIQEFATRLVALRVEGAWTPRGHA
jgi:hypothetical protein